MLTGDTHINADAPIICCTAEILANQALREGRRADVGCVAMDEFHYYGDSERGWAWQVPLLTLPDTQFLLMSATLGNVDAIADKLEDMTDTDVDVIATRRARCRSLTSTRSIRWRRPSNWRSARARRDLRRAFLAGCGARHRAVARLDRRVQQGAATGHRRGHQGCEVHEPRSARYCNGCCVPASASTMPACCRDIVVSSSSLRSRGCCRSSAAPIRWESASTCRSIRSC